MLLDIDKAIRIIRRTEKDEDVVPNLMKGFSITEEQANFIAEIKLRNLNKDYILNKTKSIEQLTEDLKTTDSFAPRRRSTRSSSRPSVRSRRNTAFRARQRS